MPSFLSLKKTLPVFFLLILSNSWAQTREFDMFLAGKKIGSIVTDKKVKGDIEVYTMTSTATSTILWKTISTYTTYHVVFKSGKLQESYFEHKENGEIEKFCKVKENAGGYSVHHSKTGKFEVQNMAEFCLLKMYYNEPSDGVSLLNEGWGEYVKVKKSGANQYEFKTPDGSKYIYRFQQGKMTDAEFHTSIVTVRMKPKV